MIVGRQRCVVLQFVVVLGCPHQAFGTLAEGERLLNINRRAQPERKLVIDIPLKLKPRFIDHSGAQNLRVADLNGVLSLIQVVSD